MVHDALKCSQLLAYGILFYGVFRHYRCDSAYRSIRTLTHTCTHTRSDPPSIIYTTEFIISNKNEFGLSGEVTCTTQASAQVSSTVSWFTRGTEITNSTKYSIVTLPTDSEEDEIVKYKLIVSDLQETDIGSYLCRLNSMYGMEDMQEAWIKVDYRKSLFIHEHIVS